MNNEIVEVEGFGVTYDRYIMYHQQRKLVDKLDLKKVLESPSFGAKAAGSLYSLGYSIGGCDVTLANPELEPLHYWEDLGVKKKVKVLENCDYIKLPFENDFFDLAWNFVTFSFLPDQQAWLEEMIRVSKRYVMVISCNNFQLGYPLHRLIHKIYGFPWNHGKVYFNHIQNVKSMFKASGLRVLEYGAIDSPPWPDPVGFRDIRLHKHSDHKKSKKIIWEVPFVKYLKENSFPLWMQTYKLYDIPFRRGYWKLPFSHLFYVIAKKE